MAGREAASQIVAASLTPFLPVAPELISMATMQPSGGRAHQAMNLSRGNTRRHTTRSAASTACTWITRLAKSAPTRTSAPSRALDEGDVCPYSLRVAIDWGPKKAADNLREHGVSFAEAATVLADDYALTREDPDSIGEQRFVTLGMSATGDMLVLVYTHREPDIYRIISAWKANKPQRKHYEKGRR